MCAITYNKSYYNDLYNDEFSAKQQSALEECLSPREGGFGFRVSHISNFLRYINGKDVLDMGCGVGTFAFILAKRGYNVVGLDISDNCIGRCRANLTKFNIPAVKFIIGDCSEHNFAENCFDSIIAADIIEHLPAHKLKRTLANCHKWLRPGGTIIIHTFPTKYYHLALGKRALFLLPLYCMPKNFAHFYAPLANSAFNFLYMILKGRSYDSVIARGAHCNPPHPFAFKALLEEAGFNVIEYELAEEAFTCLAEDAPRYDWCKALIRRHKILQPSIIVVARK